MDIVLLAVFPVPLRLLTGLLVLLAGVLTLYWFFMKKNNPKSQQVDALTADDKAQKLQDQFNRGEITEEDYRMKLKELEKDPKLHP